MIEATAQENRRALQNSSTIGAVHTGTADAGGSVGNGRRTRRLILLVGGLVVAAAIGGVILASKESKRQPPVAAADHAPDGGSGAIGTGSTSDEPVKRPLSTEEPGGLGRVGVEEKQTAEGEIETVSASAAQPDDRTAAAPVAEQSPEEPNSGELAAHGHTSTEVLPSEPSAPAMDTTSAPLLPPQAPSSSPAASGTGSSINRPSDPVATHIARATSAVKMRAGPGNSEAVLATIPGGSPVEVINCRQWCEVMFAGQRGWVYKSFIGPSPIPPRH